MALTDLPLFAENVTWEEAEARLAEEGLSDGLPSVPPTERRLLAMLGGRDPRETHGFMPPLFGELTSVAVAYCCVLAGCRPDHLPVVIAAAKATLAPEFNLLGLMTTTGAAAVATLVHGPVVTSIGMNTGVNCLGPGNRANAAIGRAMSLVLRNIGGAREEAGDMATCGQPGKYAFCFAEAAPLWPAIHERRGLARSTSAVTVLGVSGTAEILPLDDRDTPEDILAAVASSMAVAHVASGAAKQPERPEQWFVLPPELAGQIAAAGWDLSRVQQHLFAAGGAKPFAPSPADIHPIVTGGPGVKMAYLPMWGGGSRTVTVAID